MEVSNDFDSVASCIIHKMNQVQAGVKSELGDVASLFDHQIHLLIDVLEFQIGLLAKGGQILTASVQDEGEFVQVKLDILLASHDVVDYKLDKLGVMQQTLNDKLDAQATLCVQGFKLVVRGLVLVLIMLIFYCIQNACHVQWAMRVAVPRETPTPTWVVKERSDLQFMGDLIFYLCTGMYMTQ